MENNIILDENFAAVHAYLCADGYVSGNNLFAKHKYYHIGLRNTNFMLLSDFQTKFEKVFGKKPIISKQFDRCNIGNKEIFFWLKQNFGSFHSAKWTLPAVLLKRKVLSYWLRAFFDCEAWVEAYKGKNRAIGLESINLVGLQDIARILETFFWIKSFIRTKKNGKIFYLGIFGKNNLIRFRNKIGFNHPSKITKLEAAISSFIDYNWRFPPKRDCLEKFVISFLKGRIKSTAQKRIRICSNKRKNLVSLSGALAKLFSIESKISKVRFNGFGTKYFELTIQKKESVSKLVNILH